LLEIRDVLAEVEHAAGAWKEARRDVEHAEAELAVAHAAEAARAEERDAARARLGQDDEALAVARATATALREAIDAEDGALFDRVGALDSAAQRAIEALRGLATRLNAVSAGRGRAESELATVEAERERTTELRNAAHARLRELIDARVPEHLLLELPEQHSSSVEHVRAQAAEIRRAVRPRQWQLGDPRENAERVGDLRVAMESQARDARGALEQGGRSLQIIPEDRLVRVDVTVNSNGQVLPIDEALPHLNGVVETLESSYDAGVQQTLNELLGSTFLEHMRDQIGVATTLVRDINRVLADHPTGTNHTTLRIKLEPGANRHVLDAITGPTLANPDVAAQVREFLREKVDEAKRTAVDEGHPDWRDSLADHLDYRNWYGIALERRFGASNWGPLTTRSYAELSGGARAVMLMLPLIGALAALYRHMPDAPRPLWLDEAFDGLDATNRSVVMRLLREFDLDVLLAGPGRLVNVAAVPTAAIYQVVRAREPEPGADHTLELWAGNTLEAIELPLSWLDDAPPPEPDAQDALL
ncbi:MAG: hypothetical protein GX596_02805, partial [Propionibacterium sp.]|nr:hypothetical protein [Propionibacterium sp.]